MISNLEARPLQHLRCQILTCDLRQDTLNFQKTFCSPTASKALNLWFPWLG